MNALVYYGTTDVSADSVPDADFNCLQLPPGVKEEENDCVVLSDIFPARWHATRLAGITPGDSVVMMAQVRQD